MGNTTSWQFISVTCPRCGQWHLSRVGSLRRTDPQALESRKKLCPICETIVNPPQEAPEPSERLDPPLALTDVFKRWKDSR